MHHGLTKVHVFTDQAAELFQKQFPGGVACHSGFQFSFGREIAPDAKVLIVFNRTHYTITTRIPKHRTAIIAAEPDVIHKYKRQYLEQFGIVVTTQDDPVQTLVWNTATLWFWYVGVNYDVPVQEVFPNGYDYFSTLAVPPKTNKISVVTSDKTLTEFQRRRLEFLDHVARIIPDHLEIYGRGGRFVGDKAEALIPHKYHLALENCVGAHKWTEKLADPLLCWAFPFYFGCDNLDEYFPSGSYCAIDLDQPEAAAKLMAEAVENDRWQTALQDIERARTCILEIHNLAFLLVRLAEAAMKNPASPGDNRRILWSERSLRPQQGARGSWAEWVLRNGLLSIDVDLERRLTVYLREKRESRRQG